MARVGITIKNARPIIGVNQHNSNWAISLDKQYRTPSVAIVGAGMTGILLAIKLREEGIKDITIYEKKDRVGGTWRENTYPGVACDTPGHIYAYSFKPNAEWDYRYARGKQLHEYFEEVFAQYHLDDITRFNDPLTEAEYHDEKWHIKSQSGHTQIVDFLFSATGILHSPVTAKIKGQENFAGESFHTSNWNHEIDLKDKRIGIIGTGSTSAQIIPSLVNQGVDVTIFQRTPQWVLPMPDFIPGTLFKGALRTIPGLTNVFRYLHTWFLKHVLTKAVTGSKLRHAALTLLAKKHLNAIKDDELREKLKPDYTLGCKRIIISTALYPALEKPNAHLITESIDHIEENGVKTKDGKLHELDVIAYATGFNTFRFMRPMKVIGKNGVDIEDQWAKKIQAYCSVHLANFPNFFLMLGPNTPIGNFSVTMMSEVQTDHILKLIRQWRKGKLQTIEAKESAVQDYNTFIKKGLGKTVWASGCDSWYLDADGDPVLWPYTWQKWTKIMGSPRLENFVQDN